MSINKELLDILACPKCRGEIALNEKEDGLICVTCKLIYPVREDIPVMLIDEAMPLAGHAALAGAAPPAGVAPLA